MPNYTKLFNSIVTSTIWTEDDKTRILWITMLAISDQNGEVHASIPGLARIAGIDVPSTEKAIEAFLSPDPYSRTLDNQGRRIAKIDGGWELLNHAKYRKMASKEDSKAATAARVKRYRDRNANVTPCNAPVTACNGDVTVGRDIAEAEAEADSKKELKSSNTPLKKKREPKKTEKPTLEQIEEFIATIPDIPKSEALALHGKWVANGFTVSDKPIKNWQATIRNWNDRGFLDYQKHPVRHGIPRSIHEVKPFRGYD